jgi:hypothetical protein
MMPRQIQPKISHIPACLPGLLPQLRYPILLMAMPATASTALALNMIVENLIMIPLVLVMAEHAKGGSGRGWTLVVQIAGRLIRNPIVIALITGLAVSLLGLGVPGIIAKPIWTCFGKVESFF